MPLEILFQDQWIVVVNKPAGMLVHAGREPEPRDQIAMKVLRDQIGQRVSTIHRLDRPTSGALLFSLDTRIDGHLRKQFDRQAVEKIYRAAVCGEAPEEWTSREPLQKSDDDDFRTAETHFKRNDLITIGSDTFSILTAVPKSGRFHQIRKHASMRGFPIVGDYLYGEVEKMDRIAESIGQPRLMLHAEQLIFEHPLSGETIEVSCPLPDRFAPFQ